MIFTVISFFPPHLVTSLLFSHHLSLHRAVVVCLCSTQRCGTDRGT